MLCTAWHESAHAVLCELAGFPVTSVYVRAAHGYSARCGHVDHGFYCGAPAEPDADFEVMLAAGWAAEHIIQADPDEARKHAAGDLAALAMVGVTAERELEHLRQRATAILRRYERAWSALAHFFEAGGQFPGQLVRSVLSGQPGDPLLALCALEQRKLIPA